MPKTTEKQIRAAFDKSGAKDYASYKRGWMAVVGDKHGKNAREKSKGRVRKNT